MTNQTPQGWGPPQPPSRKPRRRPGVRGWIGIIVGGLVLVLVVIGAIAGGSQTSTSARRTDLPATTAATTVTTSPPTTELATTTTEAPTTSPPTTRRPTPTTRKPTPTTHRSAKPQLNKVPEEGLEPSRPCGPNAFKARLSADSSTPAHCTSGFTVSRAVTRALMRLRHEWEVGRACGGRQAAVHPAS